MRIAAINNLHRITSFKADEHSQTDYIETQTKQIIRENFVTIQDEAANNVFQVVEHKYRDEFTHKIEQSKKTIGVQDIISIFTDLRDAYSDAGLNKDADVIGAYIKKLLGRVKK